MTEIRHTFTADDSGLLAALKAQREAAIETQKAIQNAGNTQKEASEKAQKAIEDNNKALEESIDQLGLKVEATKEEKKATEESTKKTEKNTEAVKKDTKATEEWKEEVKKAVGEVKILGVNVTQLISNLKAKAAAMKSATTAMGGTTKGLKALRIALISTGIGALVVALGSLIAYFSKTQKGVDQVNRVLKGMGAVVDGLLDRFAGLGSGLLKLVRGDFSGAAKEFRNAWNGAWEDIGDNFKEGFGIEKQRQELEAAYMAIENQRAKDRVEIKALNKIAEDTTKSFEERANAANKAIQIEQESLQKLIETKEAELKLQQRANAISDTSRSDKQKELDIENDISALREQSLELQTTLQNKLNTINQQAVALRERVIALNEQERLKVEVLRSAYLDLFSSIQDRIDELNYDKLTPSERIEADQERALAAIDKLIQQAQAKYLEAYGVEIDLTEKAEEAKQLIREKYAKQREDLEKGIFDKIVAAEKEHLSKLESVLKEDMIELNDLIVEPDKVFPENLIERLRERFKEAFNLTDDDLTQIGEGFTVLSGEIGNLLSGIADRRLEENDRIIESLKKQTEVVQSELESQLELQAQGRSNNVESKRKELEEIQKAEKEAYAQRARIAQQQARIQLAADLALQTSNLLTAISKIMATNAGIPVVGLLNAGVAIASMLAAFGNAKAQAASIAGVRAYKGGVLGDYIDGPGKRNSGFIKRGGRSDIPGRGDGYPILGTDVVVGGDEYLINENTSRRHAEFLDRLNAGMFDNMNLNVFKAPDLAAMTSTPNIEAMNRLFGIRNKVVAQRKTAQERRIIMEMTGSRLDDINKNLEKLIDRTKQIMPLNEYQEGYVEFDGKNKRIVRK